MKKLDKELEEYRSMMDVPAHFEEGFKLSSVLGALFIGLIMVPGAIYMELVAGQGIGPAAQWVTVILFIEVAKRANVKLPGAQIFILFYMAGAIVSSNADTTILFRQFLVRSEAAVTAGIADLFPAWVAPRDPAAYEERSFLTLAWLPVLGLIAIRALISKWDGTVLSYGLFRRMSDIERLPFPLAPVGAQGILALAEDLEGRPQSGGVPWRWRLFSIGGALGMVFGFIYLGIPTLSGALLESPITFLPIPFADWTHYTKETLPAAATGISFDLGNVILGMVLPYSAVIGTFAGALALLLANPVLYKTHILTSWTPGNKTVETVFKNNLDLYFSFGIGLALAIAAVSFRSVWRSIRDRKSAEPLPEATAAARRERGGLPDLFVLGFYVLTTLGYILLCGWLIDWHQGVMIVLFFYGFFYTPLISYVTAKLEGLAGQVVEIPFIREISFILSGYHGIAIWFLPIPKANYGAGAVFYRQAELTGTKFGSIWKADFLLYPFIVIATLGFSSFIWSLGEVPSPVYPYTQAMWELEAKNSTILYSSTLDEYSLFHEAFDGTEIAAGLGTGLALFAGLSWVGAPVMLYYGLMKGLSGTLIHMLIPQLIGALLGKFYFERKFGPRWKKYIVVLSAGFFAGSGLVTIFCVGLVFLKGATISLPY